MTKSKLIAGFSQTAVAMAVFAAFNPAQAQVDTGRLGLAGITASPAQAQVEPGLTGLTVPTSSLSVGIGAATGDTKDRAQFGVYNGLRVHDNNLLLDFDYRSRVNATGTWTQAEGRNLGLDNRELRFGQNKQGDWKYGIEYSEITRHSVYTINTAMGGAGSTTPNIVRLATPGTGSDVDLKTERKGWGVLGEKWLTSNLLFEATFRNEDKDGARLWGRGYDCAAYVCGTSTATAMNQALFVKNAILLVPEPVNSNIKQFEAKLTFHDEKLSATAGYYGSFYNNNNGTLTPSVPGSLNNGQGNAFPLYPAVTAAIIAGGGMSLQQALQLPMALQPDNQAHQFNVFGNYRFTPSTKATFKYAYTRATQDQTFDSQGLTGAPADRNSLGGRVDSVLAQLGFTTRATAKLSLNAGWRYESKDDKTPEAVYNVEGRGANPATVPQTYTNVSWKNGHTSTTRVAGKVEGSYQLPAKLTGTVGLDYSTLERQVPDDINQERLAGITTVREKNSEAGYRLELARAMSDTFGGRISYMNTKRRGDNWTSLSTLDPTTPGISAANLALINTYCGGRACYGQQLSAEAIVALSGTVIFPVQMTDMTRQRWKLSANWNPMERLGLQFTFEDTTDETDAKFNPLPGGKGWRDTDLRFLSVDATYDLSDAWKLTGYVSRGKNSTHINHSTGYTANIDNTSDNMGLGIAGKVSERLQLGGNLGYFKDATAYELGASTSATGGAPTAANLAQAAVGLPDVTLRKTSLALFANYALEKKSDIQVDLVHQRAKIEEWVWGYNGVPFVYGDNTTVNQQQDQNVTFVGVRYRYKF